MKKSGSVFFIAFCFFCLLLSAVNLNEPISEKTNLFDLAQLEKKLEEVLGFKFSFAPKQAEETKKTVENQEFTESSPANEPSSDLNQSSFFSRLKYYSQIIIQFLPLNLKTVSIPDCCEE